MAPGPKEEVYFFIDDKSSLKSKEDSDELSVDKLSPEVLVDASLKSLKWQQFGSIDDCSILFQTPCDSL